jgi:hypothetical protein
MGANMAAPSKRIPTSLLLDPCYWRTRLSKLESDPCGLMLIERPDLTNTAAEIVEWRLRAHDGVKLWGLRGSSRFHPEPTAATIREVEIGELPAVDLDAIAEGTLDFVFQIPAGRRLEDRVLDLVRIYQVVLQSGIDPERIRFSPRDPDHAQDEFVIAAGLVQRGLC